MTRDWKPGDVALVEAGCWANRKVALRLAEGWSHVNGVSLDEDGVVTPVRRLVVIDPEDRKQVDRLFDAFDQRFKQSHTGSARDDLQAALRSLITPPKPEEPLGDYAAVATESEGVFIRAPWGGSQPWYRLGSERTYPWSRVAAVRVLSPGVQP